MLPLVKKLFVDNAKFIMPFAASVPGLGVMLLELQDYADTDPATIFDVGTFALGTLAFVGYLGEKAVRKFIVKEAK